MGRTAYPCCAVLQKLIAFLSLVSPVYYPFQKLQTSITIYKGFANETGRIPEEDQNQSSTLDEKKLGGVLRKIIFGCALVGLVAGTCQCFVSLSNLWSTYKVLFTTMFWQPSASRMKLAKPKVLATCGRPWYLMLKLFITLVLDEGLIFSLMILTCFSMPFANSTRQDETIMPLTH